MNISEKKELIKFARGVNLWYNHNEFFYGKNYDWKTLEWKLRDFYGFNW